jgi:hypothetical protein
VDAKQIAKAIEEAQHDQSAVGASLRMAVRNNKTENRFLGCWRGFRELAKNHHSITPLLHRATTPSSFPLAEIAGIGC